MAFLNKFFDLQEKTIVPSKNLGQRDFNKIATVFGKV